MCVAQGKRPVPAGAYVLSKCLSVCASWKMWYVRDHEVYEFEMFSVEHPLVFNFSLHSVASAVVSARRYVPRMYTVV